MVRGESGGWAVKPLVVHPHLAHLVIIGLLVLCHGKHPKFQEPFTNFYDERCPGL